MSCINKIHEFRVIGGDPFMHKEMHKVVDRLKKYDQVEKIVIYTNATIIPKGTSVWIKKVAEAASNKFNPVYVKEY